MSYSDMERKVTRELTMLPPLTARVKLFGVGEKTIKLLSLPPAVGEQEYELRLEHVIAHTRSKGCMRPVSRVEQEIAARHARILTRGTPAKQPQASAAPCPK